jgi:hypothetical protein
VGRELVHGWNTIDSQYSLTGEANGVAMVRTDTGGSRFVSTLADQAKYIPDAVPFSVFAFLVRRGSNNGLQDIVRSVGDTGSGWTFQLSYGSGQLGLTRWGIADNITTTLGAVPSGGAQNAIGLTLDGTTARFFLNGRFENVASGSVNLPSGGATVPQVGNTLFDVSLHVVYLWNRVLSDGEMLRLQQDPFAPIRPRNTVYDVAALTGTARATQIVGEVLSSPTPGLRATQIVLEALIPQVGRTRATQIVLEAITLAAAGTGHARITQALSEVLWSPAPSARATQIVLEVLSSPTVTARVTQLLLEVLTTPTPGARATQSLLEVLVQPAALTPTHTGQLFPRGSPLPF